MFRLFVLQLSVFLLVMPWVSASAASASADLQPYVIEGSRQVELSDSQDRQYNLYIQLPPSYEHSTHAYPVVYMTDANYSFPMVSAATRFPMRSGKMHQAILVAISYQKGKTATDSRIKDYTPHKARSWKRPTGGAPAFKGFLKHQVMAYMAKHYRTDSTRRVYMGNSLGGLFGAYILAEEPTLFRSYILGSPSLWFDQSSLLTSTDFARLRQVKSAVEVFVGIGEKEQTRFGAGYDMVTDTRSFINTLKGLAMPNLRTRLYIIAEADHSIAFPTSAIHGLDWVLGVKE